MQVNWYRNASEKDNDKVHGTGELIKIVSPHGTSESIAIIVCNEGGSFVEKPLSLVKQTDVKPTNELDSKINQLEAELEVANNRIKELTERLANKPIVKSITKK